MAHKEQNEFIASIKRLHYNYFDSSSVLEIGSWNINGTVRDFFTNNTKYIGLDIAPGNCVDIVCSGDEYDTVDRFDVVISCECFEHNPKWVETFNNAIRLAKPNALIMITCATTGRKEHGTSKSEPENSLTSSLSDYYRNLTQQDFESHFNFDELFSEYKFIVNDTVHDLYFYGIKKDMINNNVIHNITNNEISIGAMYSTFDGLELLETSILSIRSVVDYIVIVHQPIDFYGNACDPIYKDKFDSYKKLGLINDIIYVDNLDHNPELGMITKRNIALAKCIEYGCSYVIPMDADECYDSEQLVNVVNDMHTNNIGVCYSPIITYYKDKHHYFFDSYYVPSIYKLTNSSKFYYYDASVMCDPTRRMQETSYKIYDNFYMHHLSYVYNDLTNKYRSSISRNSEAIVNAMNRISYHFDNWKEGDDALVFGYRGTLTYKKLLLANTSTKLTLSDFTLITCSYETPEITETMLKSFKYHNSELSNMNIIIMENSHNDNTRNMLKSYNIDYITNIGGTHSISLDYAIKQCKTKYAIVVDTDIIFTQSILKLVDYCTNNTFAIGGYEQHHRGNYKLKPRINPWFMIIDIESINSHNISFHCQKRISESKSNELYSNVPVCNNTTDVLYDVGATFYEDIINKKLHILKIPTITTMFKHYEGASWRNKSNDSLLVSLYADQMSKYKEEINKYKNVNITNFFTRGF